MNCPKCLSNNIKIARNAFIEIGEWNGKAYNEEFSAQEYSCGDCGFLFYAKE